jgi:CheY-like chemotaxis protein
MVMDKLTPIMYIDDDSDDQEIFKQALSALKINFPVISFWNGADALHYLLSGKVHPFIIFCDINMPKMDGFQLRKRISENKQLERTCIPFIFYSTNADKKYVDMAYELTVQGYFKKPSNNDEIKKQLKRIIDYWGDCKCPGNS